MLKQYFYKTINLFILTVIFFPVHGQTYLKDDITAKKGFVHLSSLPTDTGAIRKIIDIAKYFVVKPGEEPADISMAKDIGTQALSMSTALNDTALQILSNIVLSQTYHEGGQLKIAYQYRDRALALSANHHHPVEAAQAYMEAANYYNVNRENGGVQKKITYYGQAIRLLREAMPRSKMLADAMKYYADLKDWNYETSLSTLAMLKEAVEIYHELHDEHLEDIYTVLSHTYSVLDNPRESLRYGILAVQVGEKLQDTSLSMSWIYNNIAHPYLQLNEPQKAISYLKKALVIAERNRNQDYIVSTMAVMAHTYERSGDLKAATKVLKEAIKKCSPDDYETFANLNVALLNVYNTSKAYTEGAKVYAALQKLQVEHQFHGTIGEYIYVSSTDFLIGTRRFEEAEKMFTALEKFVSSKADITNLNGRVAVQHIRFKLDSAQGRLMDAIKSYQRYKLLGDTLDNRNHDQKITQLETEFEVYKKDEDIAEKAKSIKHLEKETQLQKLALNNRTKVRNLLIATAGLLALLLVISYRNYQIKRRANLELSEQREEINTQNDYLKELLQEREWLLKEIHHRVKNNLQIVISLLNSQSAYLTDPATLNVLRDSQHRMNSISLIHQKLYQGDNLAGVYMPTYIGELTEFLQSSFSSAPRIKIETDVAQVTLDVSQAVPLGLIMNEAITNAIKYAFGNEAGRINIGLTQLKNQLWELLISDNGKGLPEGFDPETAESLGMNLMRGLTGQLDGNFEIRSTHNGVTIRIRWTQYRLIEKNRPKEKSN
ncbi:MAG: histidine kinase dimerization/phosphoacceptor domain -containing protein [Mucilaginibacter sp.]|uniref:tetratricopeptide repeat-containing sensor histidine kinase n=1 Tax=Mucilaginibacter sp. TaxID=1882438 RepID=UPI0031A4AE0D